MRRRIPKFKAVLSEGESYEMMLKIPELKEIVLEETLFAIKEGVDKKKKSTLLFELVDLNYYIELKKDNWKLSLENVLEFYVEREDYDKCVECRDLINKL
jgi:hypothetical protein